jgi:RNA polymerase sigma-70 factor (ECF subfamily)
MDPLKATTNELAQGCARSTDAAEWGELVRRCRPLVATVVLRVCRLWLCTPTTALIDDVVQEVFLKLCEQERRILRDFRPRGEDSFLGLLRIVAASVANDHFRRLYSVKRGGKVVTSSLGDEQAVAGPDQLQDSAELQQAVLLAQLDKKMRLAPDLISERDRTIFWLYYRQGFTADEIAHMTECGLSAKGVESALRRVTLWVRDEIEKRRPGEGEAQSGSFGWS